MNVLIIDDCALEMRPMMEMWKAKANLPITWKYAESGREGIRMLQHEPMVSFGLVLMDGNLVGEYGHEVVAKIRAQNIPVLICMFSSNAEQNELGERAGAEYSVDKAKFMEKDFKSMDNLAAIIQLALLRTSP